MKTQITHVSPIQTAKVFAAITLVMSIPMVLLMMIPMGLMPGFDVPFPFLAGLLIIVPVFYAVFSFLAGALGAWIYNRVAGLIGGIEYTSKEVKDDGTLG